MTDRHKNPYSTETPEWQLFENMVCEERRSLAFSDDATRFAQLAQKAREKSQAFRSALEKLTGEA